MRKLFINQLASGNWITGEQHQKILEWLEKYPFSLHWELRSVLYAGILLLAAGIGIIIYENIETIGHTAIIFLIGLACASCFYYCFKYKLPYSNKQIIYESPWFDYVLLLGCMLFLALESYLQYQYNLFGTRYGLATLIPALLFFIISYYFDHAGVLSMAITALVSFAGITVSPGIIFSNYLLENSLIYTGASMGVFLIGIGYFLKNQEIKWHFTFTYYNFGFNLYFLSMLSAMFTLEYPFLYFGLHAVGCVFLTRYAIYEKSFYFLLMAVIYGYIALTWAVFQLKLDELIGLYYFVFSCVGIIWFLLNFKKILKLK